MNNWHRIARVGVELEGGWDSKPEARMVHDGSVNGTLGNIQGELPSPPFRGPEELATWMKKHYPPYVDRSCGLHVHVSFKTANSYVRIMDKEFFDYVIRKLRNWGKRANIKNTAFWSRLDGENHYCQAKYNPMGQVRYSDKGPNRYSILNYCYSRYKTVELRVLPAFKEPDVAVAAVQAYLGIVEQWLQAPPRSLRAQRRMVILEAEALTAPAYEEITETYEHVMGEEELCASSS